MTSNPRGDIYRSIRDDTVDLLHRSGATGEEPVPACPGWSVTDLLRHLAGLAGDWSTAELEVYASVEWTARHIARYADRDLAELVDAWTALGDRLADELDRFDVIERLPAVITTAAGPAPIDRFPDGILIDTLHHHYDLAVALGASPTHRPELERLTKVLVAAAHPQWVASGHPPAAVNSTESGPIGRLGKGDVVWTVAGDTFDLFRSLGGRRTLDQVLQRDWSPPSPVPPVRDLVVRFFQLPPTRVEPGPRN